MTSLSKLELRQSAMQTQGGSALAPLISELRALN